MKRYLITVLCICLMLCGCAQKASATNLMADIIPNEPETKVIGYEFSTAQYAFTATLLNNLAEEKEQFMVSPYSLSNAFALLMGGANGQTKDEIADLVAGNMESGRYNACLAYYNNNQKDSLLSKNSVWYKNDSRLNVNKDFLQLNADYFGADAYKINFDESGKQSVNSWAEKATKGEIKNLVDRFKKDSVMLLINALTFSSNWHNPYNNNSIVDGEFTAFDKSVKKAQMMYSNENMYISYNGATGFMKPYENGDYLFAAILPEENTDIFTFMKDIDGTDIKNMLDSAEQTSVRTALPKFKMEYSAELNEMLMNAGIKTAFDEEKADFSKMGTYKGGNIYLDEVLHKTYINVDNMGTTAGAVTKIEMATKTSLDRNEETVILNRPFMFMILDAKSMLPIFAGAVTTL